MALNNTIIKTYIDFNDNTIIKNQLPDYQGDNNFSFRQGRTDFDFHLTPVNGDKANAIILDESTTTAYVFNDRLKKIVGSVTIDSIDQATGLITIIGQNVITHEFGKNFLIIKTDKGTTWNAEYTVVYTAGYTGTLPPFNPDGYYTIPQIDAQQKAQDDNISKNAEDIKKLQEGGGGITVETDPIYTKDKPNIALKSELTGIEANRNAITSLETNKADQSELDKTNTAVGTNASDIANNKTLIDGKAEQNDLDTTNSKVSAVTSSLDSKANKTLSNVVALDQIKSMTDLDDLAGQDGKVPVFNESTGKYVLTPAGTLPKASERSVIDTEITKQVGNKLSAIDGQIKALNTNKLDSDFGNANLQGFAEKLGKEGVALKSELPKKYRAPFMVEDDEIQNGDPVVIDQNCTEFNLNLQGDEAQKFMYQLPSFVDYPNLEKLRIKMLTSQDGAGDEKRASYEIRTPHQVFVGGARKLEFDNIKIAILDLTPDREDNKWVADIIYNEVESENNVTITDEYGNSETTNNIQLGRNLRINKGTFNQMYEDEPQQDDEFEVTGMTEEPLTNVTKIEIDPNFVKALVGNDGIYKTLEYSTEIKQAVSKQSPTNAKVFINNTILDTYGGVEVKQDTKEYGIQELDGLDPNITGGEAYAVAVKLSLKGEANEDFTFRTYLTDGRTNLPLSDENGSVYEVVKNYKKGDTLGDIYIYGVDVVKGITEFYITVIHDCVSDGIVLNDRMNGNTSIALQGLTKNNKTGKFINQFIMDNNIPFKYNHQYVGASLFNLKYLIPSDYAPQSINVGNERIDGITVFTTGMIAHSVTNGMMKIEAKDLASFGIGKIFDTEVSREIENSDLTIKTTLADPTNAVRVSLMGYNGNALMKDNQIITGYNNMTPTMAHGWRIIQSLQINENPRNTVNAYTEKLSVPLSGYDNYAVFIHTAQEQQPNSITFQSFEISSDINKDVWIMIAPPTVAQMQYRYSQNKLILDEICPSGYASLRYTINSKWTKMPIGDIKSGNAMLKKVKIWTDSGYSGEGGLEALTDMQITVSYYTNNGSLHIGEKATRNQEIDFAVAVNQADWDNPITHQKMMSNLLPLKDGLSDYTFTSTTINLKKGDKFSCYMKSGVDDGAYIQASGGQRLYEVIIDAKEVIK